MYQDGMLSIFRIALDSLRKDTVPENQLKLISQPDHYCSPCNEHVNN